MLLIGAWTHGGLSAAERQEVSHAAQNCPASTCPSFWPRRVSKAVRHNLKWGSPKKEATGFFCGALLGVAVAVRELK